MKGYTTTFKPRDCQQIFSSIKTVSVHPGPMMVRVHESKDVQSAYTPHRYFISVDLKFKVRDALREDFWQGCTKAEATREAKELARRISVTVEAIKTTKASSMNGKDLLIQRHENRLQRLTAAYTAEIIEA